MARRIDVTDDTGGRLSSVLSRRKPLWLAGDAETDAVEPSPDSEWLGVGRRAARLGHPPSLLVLERSGTVRGVHGTVSGWCLDYEQGGVSKTRVALSPRVLAEPTGDRDDAMATTSNNSWLKQEFARAKERSMQLPTFARPSRVQPAAQQVVRGSSSANRPGQGTASQEPRPSAG